MTALGVMRLKTRYLLILQAVVLVVVVFGASRGTMTAGAPQQSATGRAPNLDAVRRVSPSFCVAFGPATRQ